MKIELKPELEALIRQDVERGAYKSVDEFVEQAVSLLHEQEAWLTEQGSEIRAKIEEGYAAAQRGDLIESGEVRSHLEKKKRAWLTEKRRARASTGLHRRLPTISLPSGVTSRKEALRQRTELKKQSIPPAFS